MPIGQIWQPARRLAASRGSSRSRRGAGGLANTGLGAVSPLRVGMNVPTPQNARPQTVSPRFQRWHPDIAGYRVSTAGPGGGGAQAGHGGDEGWEPSSPEAVRPATASPRVAQHTAQSPLPSPPRGDPRDLTVVLKPSTPHSTFQFSGRHMKPSVDEAMATNQRAHPSSNVSLAKFMHVAGSCVCQGLYEHYQLPDGRWCHYYQSDPIVDTYGEGPEVKYIHPVTLADIKRSDWPAEPPPGPFLGSCGGHRTRDQALLQLKPTATAEPPPGNSSAFVGKIKDVNLKIHCEVSVFVAPPEYDEPYCPYCLDAGVHLPPTDSEKYLYGTHLISKHCCVFRPRLVDTSSRSYFNTALAYDHMCTKDWERVVQLQPGFLEMLEKHSLPGENVETLCDDLYTALRSRYPEICDSFDFYSVATSSSDSFSVHKNQFADWAKSCNIPDGESLHCRLGNLNALFDASNVENKKKEFSSFDTRTERKSKIAANTVLEVNDDHALMRFEFLSIIVRVAIAKFVQEGTISNVAMAVQRLVDEHVCHYLKMTPAATLKRFGHHGIHSADTWRRSELYTTEMDDLFRPHRRVLRLIFFKYKGKTAQNAGLDEMDMPHFIKFVEDCNLIDTDYSFRDAKLAFTYSRMRVISDLMEHQKSTSISCVDFLEAIARIATIKPLPTDEELRVRQLHSIEEYASSLLKGVKRGLVRRQVRSERGAVGSVRGAGCGARGSVVLRVYGVLRCVRRCVAALLLVYIDGRVSRERWFTSASRCVGASAMHRAVTYVGVYTYLIEAHPLQSNTMFTPGSRTLAEKTSLLLRFIFHVLDQNSDAGGNQDGQLTWSDLMGSSGV